MLDLLAAITTDQIDVWFRLIDHALDRLGTLVLVAIAIWSKVESAANKQRLDRQGERLVGVENVAAAVAAPALTPEQVAAAAAQQAAKETVAELRRTATPPEKRP